MLPLILRGSPIPSFGNSTGPSQHLPKLPASLYELKGISFNSFPQVRCFSILPILWQEHEAASCERIPIKVT